MKTKLDGLFWALLAIAILLTAIGLLRDTTELPEFTILNGEHFFEIDSNKVQVLHKGDKLKLIIDGKEYYIQLYSTDFYREVMP